MSRVLPLLIIIGAVTSTVACLSEPSQAFEAYDSKAGDDQPESRLLQVGALALPHQPIAPQSMPAALSDEASVLSVKWAELQSRILLEAKMLWACRYGGEPCSPTARRFLSIVNLARQRQGR